MSDTLRTALKQITEHARAVIRGSYEDTRQITALTDSTQYPPEVTELAETFGIMAVKVEAREHALQQTIHQLDSSKRELEQTMRIREEASQLIVWFAIGFSLFVFIMAFLFMPGVRDTLRPVLIRWYGTVFTAGQLLLMLTIIRRGHGTLSQYGLTTKGWARALRDTAISTLAIGIAFIVIKAVLIHLDIAYRGEPLVTTSRVNLFFGLYLVFAPVQEFLIRGVFQSSIERILVGPHATRLAIVTSSLLFAALHATFTLPFALVSLIASLFWGVMYARHRTLIGVALSHVLLGSMFSLLDFWEPLAFRM